LERTVDGLLLTLGIAGNRNCGRPMHAVREFRRLRSSLGHGRFHYEMSGVVTFVVRGEHSPLTGFLFLFV
jgi:hypothetical protein